FRGHSRLSAERRQPDFVHSRTDSVNLLRICSYLQYLEWKHPSLTLTSSLSGAWTVSEDFASVISSSVMGSDPMRDNSFTISFTCCMAWSKNWNAVPTGLNRNT